MNTPLPGTIFDEETVRNLRDLKTVTEKQDPEPKPKTKDEIRQDLVNTRRALRDFMAGH
jgi:hypothetical protein